MLNLTFRLSPAESMPLYRQLYESLAAQLRGGAVPAGTRMPGKRSLAAELGISVNTVDTAYQMLAAEGYLEAHERSGFFTLEYVDTLCPGIRAGHPGGTAQEEHGDAVSGSCVPPGGDTVSGPPTLAAQAWRFDLSTGRVDPTLFPFRTWARIQRELMSTRPELLLAGDASGDNELRSALAEYLAAYRGVRCTPDQIVVGAGIEYLLSLLAPLLEGAAAVENPCYPRAKVIFENSGAPLCCVPVDGGGLSVEELRRSGARVCYVTPSHQFPTGVTMPAPRRAALLRWAAEAPGARYIIEDDYDSEFRYDIRPLPSLQGMAGADGPVIYLSTCSRSLAPSIRIAYMVLPCALMPAWRQRYRLYSSTVSRFEQQTLARFITGGHFTRHLARMRSMYKDRCSALCNALYAAFSKESLVISGVHTGLHLLLTLPGGPGEAEMVRRAREAGVRLAGLSNYYLAEPQGCPANTVVIGYGALAAEDAGALAALLAKLWRNDSVSSENS